MLAGWQSDPSAAGRATSVRSGLSSCALALGLGALAGCSEPPAYVISWKIVDAAALDGVTTPEQLEQVLAEASAIEMVSQCSQVGIASVEITTSGADEIVHRYPCFPGSVAYDGPKLDPGSYDISVLGLRRSGEPWECSSSSASPCIASHFRRDIEIGGAEVPEITFLLVAPPQCDDGIDNDRDGNVDASDPACIVDATASEDAESGVTFFQTAVSFLDSEVVKPANVRVRYVRLEVDGEPLVEIPDPAAGLAIDLDQHPFPLPLLSATIEPGVHTLHAVALDADHQPLTEAVERAIVIKDGTEEVVTPAPEFNGGDYVTGQFRFGDERFLAPILEPIGLNFNLLLAPGDTTGPTCSLGGYDGTQKVMIESMRIRVLLGGEGGTPIDAATLGLTGQAAVGGSINPVDAVDGWVEFECPSSSVATQALEWGTYAVEVQAQIAGQTCFETLDADGLLDEIDLAPQPSGAQNVTLDRVDSSGACAECDSDADCSGQVCESGVCVDKEPGSG